MARAVHQAREPVLRVAFPEEVARELRKAAKARLAVAQRFLGVLSLQELAEQAADGAGRFGKALVGLVRRVRREGEERNGPALEHDGERERAEARAPRGAAQRCGAAAREVVGPHGLARLPMHARATQQVLDLRFAREPAVDVAHIAARLVDAEAAARVPALALADDAQRGAHAFRGARRLGERARERVLELMDLLGALLRADVAADAAVALEDGDFVEHRLAAHRHPHDAAVFGRVLHLEVAERLVPGEQRAVALPIGVRQVERRLLPLLAADVRKGVRAVIAGPAARDDGEAKLGVLLPVPVGEQLCERGRGGGLRRLRIRGTVWCGARNRHASHCAGIYT